MNGERSEGSALGLSRGGAASGMLEVAYILIRSGCTGKRVGERGDT